MKSNFKVIELLKKEHEHIKDYVNQNNWIDASKSFNEIYSFLREIREKYVFHHEILWFGRCRAQMYMIRPEICFRSTIAIAFDLCGVPYKEIPDAYRKAINKIEYAVFCAHSLREMLYEIIRILFKQKRLTSKNLSIDTPELIDSTCKSYIKDIERLIKKPNYMDKYSRL